MGEVKDKEGKYGELSPAMMFSMMFCMIVAGENSILRYPSLTFFNTWFEKSL